MQNEYQFERNANELMSRVQFERDVSIGLEQFDRTFRSGESGDILSEFGLERDGSVGNTTPPNSQTGSIQPPRREEPEPDEVPEPPEYKRARSWCFTWNGYLQETYNAIKANGLGGGIKYIVVGRETAPTTGMRHLQGYISFANPKTMRQVKTWLREWGPGSPCLAIARGSASQNRTYCSKDGDFFEAGNVPQQGQRTDLDLVYEDVKQGKHIVDIIDGNAEAFIKYAKNIMLINNLLNYQTHRTTRPYVLWFFGSTGSGKSRDALAIAKTMGTYYYKNPTNKWWDGYVQQDCIVIDDYRRDFSTFADLLRILDWYPFSLEVKGGTVALNSTLIIFTTPKNPLDTWEGRSAEDLNQLSRRIDHVVQYPLLFPLDCAIYCEQARALREQTT